LCPIETLGDAEAEALSVVLSEPDAAVSDSDAAKLQTAVNGCAQRHGWNSTESGRSLQVSLSMISALGVETKLAAQGIDVIAYEALLENKSADDLQALLDEPEGNAILIAAIEKLQKEQGNKSDGDTAGYVAAYLVHVAQVQLLTMEAMGLAG
jgi:hypothetical protein